MGRMKACWHELQEQQEPEIIGECPVCSGPVTEESEHGLCDYHQYVADKQWDR